MTPPPPLIRAPSSRISDKEGEGQADRGLPSNIRPDRPFRKGKGNGKPWDGDRKRGRGCLGCLGNLALWAIVLTSVCMALYHGLSDHGMLPAWARIPDLRDVPLLRDLPWPEEDPEELPEAKPERNSFWAGYPNAVRAYRSPNYGSRHGREVQNIVLHCTESSTARSAINHFLRRSSKVSAHYIIDRDGTIYQMVNEDDMAWHCRGTNENTIGIEITGRMEQSISLAQTGALIQLVRDIMVRHSIPRQHIYGHDFTPGYTGSTTCPDRLFGGNKPRHLDLWLKVNLDPLLGAESL